MAEVIQFSCPACGTMLRLPLAMAGQHGPCPACRREIVAPDPYRGAAAFEAPFAYIPDVPPPFRPFSDSPPFVPGPPEIASPFNQPAPLHAPEPAAPEPAAAAPTAIPAPLPAAPGFQKPVLIASCVVSFAAALGLGYYLGFRTTERMLRPPPVDPVITYTTTPAPPATPPESSDTRGEPIPLYVKPRIEKPADAPTPTVDPAPSTAPAEAAPEPTPPAAEAPRTVSAAAGASLRAFLEAPDWATRNAHVLRPAAVRAEMEAYSRNHPDGPTAFRSIEVKHSEIDPPTGNTLFIFQITTDSHPEGFPVAVAETPQGWLTDWQTFVEFRDDLFKKFASAASSPADATGRFHLLVSRPPATRAAKTENEHFAPYLLDPPFPGRQQLAYVKKSSAAYQTIQAATADTGAFTPVLDIARRSTPEGKPYLEILTVAATDWRPLMDPPEKSSAP